MLQYLEAWIEHTPDVYLYELKGQLENARGVDVGEMTIARSLERRGMTRKRVSRIAQERSEEKRLAYKQYVGDHFLPEQLVFVDESGVNRIASKRSYAWSPVGTRARRRDFFIRGKRYVAMCSDLLYVLMGLSRFSVLPALSLDGVLHMDVLKCSWKGNTFYNFIDALLDNMNPYPQRNSVIVMDNASIHHSPELRDLVELR